MTHRFSVLLDCNLQVFLCFHLNKGLAAGTTLTRVGEVDAAATIVDNLAVCRGGMSHQAIFDLLNSSGSVP